MEGWAFRLKIQHGVLKMRHSVDDGSYWRWSGGMWCCISSVRIPTKIPTSHKKWKLVSINQRL
jgi:hypothetical protein